MRILFLDQFSEMGGAQHCLLELLEAGRQRGWKMRVALPGSGALLGRLRERGIDAGPLLRAIPRMLDASAFDGVYVNGPRLLPLVACLRPKAPVIFHAHRIPGRSYKARLAGWALKRSGAVMIACCRSVAGAFARYVPREKTHVVYNGVADMGFRLRAFTGPWRIGILGRIAPDKGQDLFLEAARELEREAPCRFVIAGAPLFSGSAYYGRIRAAAAGLPVDFMGWRDDAAGVLGGLDLLVLPSNRFEAMPRVVLEAFSAGVPVVAFAAGGIPEMIEDGVTGFLVRQPTAASLAARLRDVLRLDPAELGRVAARSRAAWLARFTLPRYQDELCSLVERLLSSNPHSAAEISAMAAVTRSGVE